MVILRPMKVSDMRCQALKQLKALLKVILIFENGLNCRPTCERLCCSSTCVLTKGSSLTSATNAVFRYRVSLNQRSAVIACIDRSGVECMYTQIIYPTKLYILEVKNHTIYRTGFFKEIKPNHKIGQKSMLIESINMKPI